MKIKCLYVYKCDPNTDFIAISGTPQCSDFHLLNKTIKKSVDFKNKLEELVFSEQEQLFVIYGFYDKYCHFYWNPEKHLVEESDVKCLQNIGQNKLKNYLYSIFNYNEIDLRPIKYSNAVMFKLKSNSMIMLNEIK